VSEDNLGGGLDRCAGTDHVVHDDGGATGDMAGYLLGAYGGSGQPGLAHYRDRALQQ
jgi:hypothetical protein